MTPLQKVQRSHVQLMRSKQFCLLSGILMCGKVTIDASVGTAATDGWNVVYNPDFMGTLNDEEHAFVVAHENFHKMLRQLTTWRVLFKTDATRANKAADYVINQMIVDLDPQRTVVSPPERILLDARYRGMDTKQVFDALGKEPPPDKRGPGEQGNGQGEPLDDHQWELAGDVSEKEQSERDAAIDIAVRQGQILAGKMGANLPRELTDLTAPKVDWREQLRDFISSLTNGKDASTWRKPNRRWMSQGMYMPSTYSETMGRLVVAIDTSGSIGGAQLSEFLSELVGICDSVSPEAVDLLWWDTDVAGHQTFERGEYDGLTHQAKPKGGGGTDPSCVPAYIESERLNPECLIYLSDGYVSSWPATPAYPVLWALNTRTVAPHGVTVHI